MGIRDDFLTVLRDMNFISDYTSEGDKFSFTCGNNTTLVTEGQSGFFMFSSAHPDRASEVFSNKKDPVLVKSIANRVLGVADIRFKDKVYSGVNIAPSKIVDGSVEFKTAKGNTFIVSNNDVKVTLGLYDILYSVGAEHSILMMPLLYPKNPTKLALMSSVDAFGDFSDTELKYLSQYAVSIRNDFISSSVTSGSFGLCSTPLDFIERKKVNNALYKSKSPVSTKSLSVKDIVSKADSLAVKLEKDGYGVTAIKSFGGVEYIFSGKCQVPVEVVGVALSGERKDMYSLTSGVSFKSKASIASFGDQAKDFVSDYKVRTGVSYSRAVLSGVEASKRVKDWCEGYSFDCVVSDVINV